MKTILSLCINLLLLIISDADPLKLIAGERSVVKKGGATHTISKYYVVPNNYDPNNVTNTTAETQHSSLRIHSLHSKGMDSGSIGKEISENKATTVNNHSDSHITVIKMNNQVKIRPDVNVGQEDVNSTESTVTMSTEQTLDSNDLGNLQVIPIYPVNISRIVTDDEVNTNVNSRKAVQNGSAVIVDNGTDYQHIEDAVDDLILSKFGTAVRELYSQNLESFWKLIKINIDKELGDDKLLATIEQLSLLLNIFTNLYEAAQVQQPVGKMIDGIVEILQKPLVEKSNRHEFQPKTNNFGDYNEECLRKCGQRSSKPQLDSNSTYLSEADGWQANGSLELENLERRQSGNSDSIDWIKMSDDPDSNEATVSNNEPANVLRDQLPVPYNLGVPDGSNVLSSTTTPTLDDVARYNDIQEDPNSIHTIPDLTETVENLDDQPVTESRFADVLPLTIKSRTADNLPWTMENETIEYFPWPKPTTPNDGLTWHIEDRTSNYHPFPIVEHRTFNKLPWNIENKMAEKGVKKPYHIYTYVIKPTATSHELPNADNILNVVSKHPFENLKTLYGLPTLHGGHKIVYKIQPPQSHYESQYSISKPTIDISRQPSYSHLVTTTYDQSQTVNPSTVHSQTLQEDNEPQYLIGSEPNHNPALLQSNTHPLEYQPKSGKENEAPAVPEIDSPPDDLIMNILSNTFEQHTEPNSHNPYDNGNRIQPNSYPGLVNKASAHSSVKISQHPGLISSSASSFTNTYGLDKPVYGGQIYQQPGAISTASANSKYTTAHNDNNVPTLVKGDPNTYPGYISKATAHSEYINVPIHGHDINAQPGLISEVHQYPVYPNVVDDFDDSILVNDVQVKKRPDYVSKASSHSKFTLPINYNAPTYDYGDEINIHPVKIQTAPDYPKVNPIIGGSTQNGGNYLVPYQPNGHKVHVIQHPSLIKTISGNQNLKLEPTYRLFTLQNLQNLENAIIKTIQMHGPGVHDDRALINLKDIINVILLLAENLEETDGTNAWYEKIFYNSQDSQHPLQHYVYNLIRQRWLHELMLLLSKNNFSINILQNPGMFSFLESWQLPKYVQNFMEAEELIHVPNPQNHNDISSNQNYLQDKFTTHTYDDLLEAPADLAKYVTKNIIDSYKTHNGGIVLSIAGVEAEPDAKAIINILKKYLYYKNYIETQENVIIRDNKLEMLKQIILFLREKGYGPNTIANLIRKLYTAVNSTEGQGCKTQYANFAKNMYDVILPVLRRSGQ